jgi:Ca-activated chloride channel family protein
VTFQSPLFFLLFIPLVLVGIYYFWQSKKKQASLQYSSLTHLKSHFQKVGRPLKSYLYNLPYFFKWVAMGFVILALARPQTADTKVKRNVEGIDIMIVLDVSDSMLIEDMKPSNRIEAAKDTIRKFIKSRTSDRIGLIIFAGEAFTMVPLTLDYDMLLKRVDDITTAQEAHIKDGTAIGVALANGANRLKDSTAKSRVMIFATDGESNSGTIDPDTGLEIAKGYGIKIYSVGIGTDGPKRIPVFHMDVFGNKVKTYEPFEDSVNDDLLGRMASETGGKYFRANKANSLQLVFSEIDNLEKTKIDVNKYVRYNEEYRRFLIWAFVFYMSGWLLSVTWLRRAP